MGARGPETERNIAVFALGGLIVLMIVAVGVRSWVARREREAPVQPPTQVTQTAGQFPHVTLHGPDGDQTIPGSSYTVVHVWLQGCQDCMPAFEAMQRSAPCKGRVVNVAYGQATPSWAENYGVRTNLVFDRGGRDVVHPLGIGSFTTFVVSPSGSIMLRDRPDRPTVSGALTPYCQ